MSLPISDNIQQNARPEIQSSEQTFSLIRLVISLFVLLYLFLNREKFSDFCLAREKLKYPGDQMIKDDIEVNIFYSFFVCCVVCGNSSIHPEIYSDANQSSDKGKLKINQFHISAVVPKT